MNRIVNVLRMFLENLITLRDSGSPVEILNSCRLSVKKLFVIYTQGVICVTNDLVQIIYNNKLPQRYRNVMDIQTILKVVLQFTKLDPAISLHNKINFIFFIII